MILDIVDVLVRVRAIVRGGGGALPVTTLSSIVQPVRARLVDGFTVVADVALVHNDVVVVVAIVD